MEKKCLAIFALEKKKKREVLYALELLSQLFNFPVRCQKKFLDAVDWTWAKIKYINKKVISGKESSSSNCPKSANFSAKLKGSTGNVGDNFYFVIVLSVEFDSKGCNESWLPDLWKEKVLSVQINLCSNVNDITITKTSLYLGSLDSCIFMAFGIIKRMRLILMNIFVFLSPTRSQKDQGIFMAFVLGFRLPVIQTSDYKGSLHDLEFYFKPASNIHRKSAKHFVYLLCFYISSSYFPCSHKASLWKLFAGILDQNMAEP